MEGCGAVAAGGTTAAQAPTCFSERRNQAVAVKQVIEPKGPKRAQESGTRQRLTMHQCGPEVGIGSGARVVVCSAVPSGGPPGGGRKGGKKGTTRRSRGALVPPVPLCLGGTAWPILGGTPAYSRCDRGSQGGGGQAGSQLGATFSLPSPCSPRTVWPRALPSLARRRPDSFIADVRSTVVSLSCDPAVGNPPWRWWWPWCRFDAPCFGRRCCVRGVCSFFATANPRCPALPRLSICTASPVGAYHGRGWAG
jgi:hypothetical protein